jgi:hypothetical protein
MVAKNYGIFNVYPQILHKDFCNRFWDVTVIFAHRQIIVSYDGDHGLKIKKNSLTSLC